MRNTSLVDISYIASSPRLAQKVAEGVGASYIRMKVEQKFEAVRNASEFLDRQIAQVRSDIEATRKKMQAYGENKGILTADESNSMTAQRLAKTNSELAAAVPTCSEAKSNRRANGSVNAHRAKERDSDWADAWRYYQYQVRRQ